MQDKLTQRKNFMLNTAYIALVIIMGLALVLTVNLFLPFWFALLVAAILQPLIRVLHKKTGHKKLLSVIALLLFYLIIGGALVYAVVEIAYLLGDFFDMFPQYFSETIQPAFAQLKNMATLIPEQFRPNLHQIDLTGTLKNAVASFSQQGLSFVRSFIDGVSSSFIGILIGIMLSYFVVSQYDAVIVFLKNQIPDRALPYCESLKKLLKDSVFKYLKSAGIMMSITFAELLLGFLIIGAENPLGMAAVSALFDALPIFGVGGILAPWAVFELLEANYTFALSLLILWGCIILFRNLLEPKVLGEQLGLNPIVALTAIYAGYKLLGIIGMISFPIIAYVLLSLHKDGKIRLYREPETHTETIDTISKEYVK